MSAESTEGVTKEELLAELWKMPLPAELDTLKQLALIGRVSIGITNDWIGDPDHGFILDPLVPYIKAYRRLLAELHPIGEFFWLIERGQPEGQVPTVWWTGEVDENWTTDAREALRFSEQDGAQKVIDKRSQRKGPHPKIFGRATAHGFLNNPVRPVNTPSA